MLGDICLLYTSCLSKQLFQLFLRSRRFSLENLPEPRTRRSVSKHTEHVVLAALSVVNPIPLSFLVFRLYSFFSFWKRQSLGEVMFGHEKKESRLFSFESYLSLPVSGAALHPRFS